MEIYLIDFLSSILKNAYSRSRRAGYNKIKLRDLLKVIEYDQKLFLRVPTLHQLISNAEKTKEMYKV
jgi:hypothetical protein